MYNFYQIKQRVFVPRLITDPLITSPFFHLKDDFFNWPLTASQNNKTSNNNTVSWTKFILFWVHLCGSESLLKSKKKNRSHYLVRIYSFAFYIPPDQISVKIFLYYFELLVHASFTILIGASCCTLSKMRFFLIIYLKTFWRLCFMQSLKRRILSYLGPTVK